MNKEQNAETARLISHFTRKIAAEHKLLTAESLTKRLCELLSAALEGDANAVKNNLALHCETIAYALMTATVNMRMQAELQPKKRGPITDDVEVIVRGKGEG